MADNFYSKYSANSGSSSSGVSSLNSLTGALTLVAGSNVTITPGSGTLTIASSGGSASPLTTKGDIFGFSTVNARIAVGTNGQLLTADSSNALGVSWQDAPVTTGVPNTFAGFSVAGDLTDLGGFTYIPATQGMQANSSNDPVTVGSVTTYSFNSDFSPSANVAENDTGFEITTQYDNAGLNFDNTGNVTGLFLQQGQNNGNGTLGALHGISVSQLVGNGVNTGTINNIAGMELNTTIGAGFTVGNLAGVAINLQNVGAITGDVDVFEGGTTGTAVTGNQRGLNLNLQAITTGNKDLITLSSNNAIGGSYRAASFNNQSNIVGNYNSIQDNNSGTIGGSYNAYDFQNQSSGVITGDYNGERTFNDAPVGGGYTGKALHNSGDVTASATMLEMQWNADAGANLKFIDINAVGAVTDTVAGISITLDNATSPNQKVGLAISDGNIQINAAYDTAILTPSFEFQLNQLGGMFQVAAGHPVTGAIGFGNNLGIQTIFNDDFGPDGFTGTIGFSVNGFINQLGVATGKTVDTFNYMLAGGSVPATYGGGTITNAAMFAALGILNGGDSITIDNLVGFRVPSGMSALATNAWGIKVEDSNAHNFFKKDVIIGGTTGLPVGTNALEVTGSALIANTATDTTVLGAQINATSTTTADGSNTTIALQSSAVGTVAVGFTNDKAVIGAAYDAQRGDGTDEGTLSDLIGNQAMVINNSGAAGVTDESVGVYSMIMTQSGTVTDHYDFKSERIPAGGTLTNHYGVFISNDSTTPVKNYLSGQTQMGGSSVSIATSALLDLQSTTGALLLPRMTTTQQNALTAVNGMMIYNSSADKFRAYENGVWIDLSGGGGGGANTALSNLVTTAFNTNLLPDTDLAYTLGDATHQVLGIYAQTLYTGSSAAIKLDTRELVDSSAITSINWDFHSLYDIGGNPSIDYANRTMVDSANNSSISYEARELRDNAGGATINWDTRIAIDNAATNSINWNTRILIDSSTATTSVDWDARNLIDESGNKTVDFTTGRSLVDDTGSANSLDWSGNTRVLIVKNLQIDDQASYGQLIVPATITAGGTTGNQTINKISGTVNFAAGASTITVTNNKVTTSSIIQVVVRTNDLTAAVKNVVPGSGSFTINLTGTATAETSVGFLVLN